ncbi:dienelactone hydrolase family protein [Phenylobacterium sp.]|uniref:dienelactone hydrolase family protein n=1 Tax=Phenylobacterium sp. TaxID=1871053 RepID=UPI0025EED451|nr:dienelactone hydrolase family protein [Phenylobacterium sp.]MBX3482934.1 dienelactone hydrolase family protein [Phenylobacterium sp.]MCW5761342.1 dienelactone hydrolase family protein [Phenylobacterium sp.]
MVTLTRPDGTRPEDLHLSRRGLTLALTGGYAVAAWSAEAQPITTPPDGLVQSEVMLKAADREIPGFLARPAKGGRFPVVILISEIFGLHEYIRDTCRRLAREGYCVLAPDFFVRAGDPSKLTDFQAILKIVGEASDRQVTGDIRAGIAFLKAQPYADVTRMAITGFCWGGNIVWEASERLADFKCGVAWYGRLTGDHTVGDAEGKHAIDMAADLHNPVLGLYAGKDSGIPLADVEKMKAALKAAGKTGSDIVVYPGVQHGFHADYRPSYDRDAATDGWSRMLAFFRKNGV